MEPTPAEFRFWRRPRRGSLNPEDQTNIFWFWCVDHQQDASSANRHFKGPSSIDAGPCWSAERFGQTSTSLPDGTIIRIGGEHEDHYDPDFYIYNDVWVESPEGELTIFGYPKSVFPPTDFHTASLVGQKILIIGSLGYPKDRDLARTPIYQLDLNTWKISPVETKNPPGWISRHTASYDETSQIITISDLQRWTDKGQLIDDFSTWQLDLKSLTWTCVETRNWTQYRFCRADGNLSDLAQIRMAAEMQNLDLSMAAGMIKDAAPLEGMGLFQEMQAEILEKANLEAIDALYRPSIEHNYLPSKPEDFLSQSIEIGETRLRFTEELEGVLLTIEGDLDQALLGTLIDETCEQIQAVEGVPYQATKLQ